LGDSETYSFEVSAREYDLNEIKDEIELNYYDEILAFSLDWDDVQTNDVKLQRQADGTFPALNTGLFNVSEHYYFCWKPPYINYERYVVASDSFWKVRDVPTINSFNSSTLALKSFIFNQKIEEFTLTEEVSDNDEFLLNGTPDWDLSNKMSEVGLSADNHFLYVWLPESR